MAQRKTEGHNDLGHQQATMTTSKRIPKRIRKSLTHKNEREKEMGKFIEAEFHKREMENGRNFTKKKRDKRGGQKGGQ